MSATRIVEDAAGGANDHPTGVPRLVVSILDQTMGSASLRRCLRAAVTALDGACNEAVLVRDQAGTIGFASGSARRIVKERFDLPVERLFDAIADWHANARGTVVMSSDGSILIVEETTGGPVLRLSDQASCAAMLTVRERDVMRGVEDGLSNTEIAQRLGIQPATVRKHLENVFDKLEVHSRTAALSKLHAARVEAS